MAGKTESFSGKISRIWTCSQISRKFSYWKNLLLFYIMLSKEFAHLYALGNNIYTRKNSQTNKYLFIVNNSNTRRRCEISLELTIKKPERRPAFFILNFEHNRSHHFLVFLLLILNKWVFTEAHPINLNTLKLLTAAIINKCTKILVKWQLIKKDSDPK